MTDLFDNPVVNKLKEYRSGVKLGTSPPSETDVAEFRRNRDGLLADMNALLARINRRFMIVIGVLVVAFLLLLLFAFMNATLIKQELLFGSSGIATGGLFAYALRLYRFTAQIEVIIIALKYAQPQSFDLIVNSLVNQLGGKESA